MSTGLSPRTRTLSDSMDYDDELAELHDRRQTSLEGHGPSVEPAEWYKNSSKGPGHRKDHSEATSKYLGVHTADRYKDDDDWFKRESDHHRFKDKGESDEDTEDASEDGDDDDQDGQQDEPQEIKEQVYYDKLALLKAHLEELDGGNHIEFNRHLTKLEKERKYRKRLNEACRDYELDCIEREYTNERLLAAREFEEKKIELRESLVSDLLEKQKQVEQDRYTMELTSDPAEVKPMSTRKLRRRPNEPIPIQEKRRKTPQSQIIFLLEDKEIEEDMKCIAKRNFKESPVKKHVGSYHDSSDSLPAPPAPVHVDARIEDGKLFYEKRWFHRGQPIFVEGKDIPRTSGIISGISQDLVWVRKLNEQAKIKVPISLLQKGKMLIKRRA